MRLPNSTTTTPSRGPADTRDYHADSLADTDAHRGKPVSALTAGQFVDQRDENSRPRRAQRVTDGDCATIDVDLVLVQLQKSLRCHALRGECRVDFKQVELVYGDPGPDESRLRSGDRSDSHDVGMDTRSRRRGDSCHRLQTVSFETLFGHQKQRRCAVVHWRGVSRGDSSVFQKDRGQFGQLLK